MKWGSDPLEVERSDKLLKEEGSHYVFLASKVPPRESVAFECGGDDVHNLILLQRTGSLKSHSPQEVDPAKDKVHSCPSDSVGGHPILRDNFEGVWKGLLYTQPFHKT